MSGMARAVMGAAAMAAAFVVMSAALYAVLPGAFVAGGWFGALVLTILVGLVFFGNTDSAPSVPAPGPFVPPRVALPPGRNTVQGVTVVINGDVHVHAAPAAAALDGPDAYAAALRAVIEQAQISAAASAAPVVRGEIVRDTPAIENRRMP